MINPAKNHLRRLYSYVHIEPRFFNHFKMLDQPALRHLHLFYVEIEVVVDVDVEVRHTAPVRVTYSPSFLLRTFMFYFHFIPAIERLICIAFIILRVSTTFASSIKRHIYSFMYLSH